MQSSRFINFRNYMHGWLCLADSCCCVWYCPMQIIDDIGPYVAISIALYSIVWNINCIIWSWVILNMEELRTWGVRYTWWIALTQPGGKGPGNHIHFYQQMGKSRNRRTFSKIENLRFLRNYDDNNCIFGIKLKEPSLSFIWRVMNMTNKFSEGHYNPKS